MFNKRIRFYNQAAFGPSFRIPPSHFRIPLPTATSSPLLLPPFPLPENNPDRRFVQAGFFPQLVDQVSFVRKMDRLGVVDKAHDGGWFGGCLDGIVKFDAFSPVKRRFIFFSGPLQKTVQLAGGDTTVILFIDLIHLFENFPDPQAG